MGTFSRRSKVNLTQEEKIKVWREMPYTRPFAEIVSMDFFVDESGRWHTREKGDSRNIPRSVYTTSR